MSDADRAVVMMLQDNAALIGKCERLQAENAKLRELVKDMFRDFANADAELKQRHGRTFMAWVRYERRLRELGVDA